MAVLTVRHHPIHLIHHPGRFVDLSDHLGVKCLPILRLEDKTGPPLDVDLEAILDTDSWAVSAVLRTTALLMGWDADRRDRT